MTNATVIETAEAEAVLAVADHPAFVFGAYFAAFGPLTIIYALDLISEKWKTVKETRRAGYFILALSFPSLTFLFIYIHMQKLAQDYKEMAAATSAAIYSVLHLLRTIWGIMQLNEFHKWNRNALLRMKALGYDVLSANVAGKLKRRKCRKNCTVGVPISKRRRSDTDSSTDFSSSDSSSKSGSADISDSSSSDEEKTTCVTPVYEFILKRTKKIRRIFSKLGRQVENLKKRIKSQVDHASESDTICESCKNIEKVEVTVNEEMVVNSSLIDNEFMHAELPCQLDLVGLAQAIWQQRSTIWRDPWRISVSDYMKCKLPEECTVQWCVAFLSRFGSSWLLDSRNSGTGNNNDDLAVLAALAVTHQVRIIEDDGQEELEHESVLSPGHAFSVDRREIQSSSLKMTLDIRESLPYKMRSDRDVKRIDFAAYESNIRDAIASWHTVSVNKLERKEREAVTRIQPYQVAMFAKLIAGTGENRIAMEDIRVAVPEQSFLTFNDQLGNIGKPNAIQAFPFRREFTNVLLWRGKFQNRLVLQASLHLDNWLSLESGYRQKSMLVNSSLEFRTKLCTEDVFTFQKNIEKKRLQNDLATSKEIDDILLIHKAKFLGCGIESVRSFLAKSLSSNSEQDLDWSPYIAFGQGVEFRVSSQLTQEISKLSSVEHANLFNARRNIDQRILWELQYALHGYVTGTLLNSSGLISLTQCNHVIMLFILSFPSLDVQKLEQTMQQVRTDPDSEVRIQEISSYLITPVEGPQPLSIKFSFNMETREGAIEIVSDYSENDPIQFDWQSWKDASLARMSAQSEWREERLYSTTENIRKENLREKLNGSLSYLRKKDMGTDFDLAYWNAWPPHCCEIAHFEIKESEELRKYERYDRIYENGKYAVKRLRFAMDSMRDVANEKETGFSLYASAKTCFNKGRKNQWLDLLIRCISDYGHSDAVDDAVSYLYSGGSLDCSQFLDSLHKGIGSTLRLKKEGSKLRYQLLDFYKVAEYCDQIYMLEPEKSKTRAHFLKGMALFYAKDFEKGIDDRCIEAFESGLFHNPDCSFYLGLSYYRMLHRNGHLEHKQMAANFIKSYKSSGILKTSFGYLLEKGSFSGRNCKRLLSLCAYVQRWEDSDILCDLFRFLFLPAKTSGLKIVHSDDDELRFSGNNSDEIQLANGLYKDLNRAAKLYRSAIRMHKKRTGAEYIEEQNPHNSGGDASNRLAMMYHRGPDIASQINKDSFGYLSHKSPILKAEKLYLEAIEMGNTDALCNVGILHADRLDEAQNKIRAVEYFDRAQSAGQTCAMNNLAFMYEHGIGCTRNVGEAQNLYEKAFRRARNPIASFNLGVLLKFGDAKERNVKRANKLFQGILNRKDLTHLPVLLSQVKVALDESLSEHDAETSFTSITEEYGESYVYLKLVYKI